MTITWQLVLAVAGGFLCIISALEKIQEIIKKAKQPTEDVEEKLARDYSRINNLEAEMENIKDDLEYVRDSLMLQMENDLVILEHMRTNNSTGKIAEREEEIKKFLLKHQHEG